MLNNTMTELKNTVRVLDDILDNMKWTVGYHTDFIKTTEAEKAAELQAAKDEGREPEWPAWKEDSLNTSKAYLKTWSKVQTHLEKLL